MRCFPLSLRLSFITVILFSGLASCAGPATPASSSDFWPTQGWRSAAPETQGMDSAKLAEMFEYIQANDLRLHSLLVVRHGYLVTEAYWPPYGPDIKHTVESNTKSVVGALVGIAIDQGLLKGVDQKLVDFFPERQIARLDEQKKAINLQNLLSMTPGLSCQDLSSDGTAMYNSDDWVQYLLDLPVTSPPGRRWIYCSGAVHLLSAILQETTGMDTRTYANRNLFTPLGIAEAPPQDWTTDPEGVSNGIAGLYLTPRDLAKFGYLYLKNGNWDGLQVVPASWVAESTREQAYIGKDDYVGGLDRRFGYLFSIFPDLKYYGYLGMAGQELFVLPGQDMVVVFTGSLEAGKEGRLLTLVKDYIIPAVQGEEALAPNPEAAEKLETVIQAAAGSQQMVPALPQVALDVTGKTYVLDDNPFAWKDMTFYFQPGAAEVTLKMSGSPDIPIGLDNRYRLTENPGVRPTGLRAHWETPDELFIDYVIVGEFMERLIRVKFVEDRITVTVKELNFGTPAVVVKGRFVN